jgi:hypothetical protein
MVSIFPSIIRGITEGIDISSFQACTRYTRPPIDCRNIILAVPSFVMPELIDYTLSHRNQNITHDTDDILKF